MGFLIAVLAGAVVGILLKRTGTDISTRFVFNAVVFALVIAQTILYFFTIAFPPQAGLTVMLVLWGMDMSYSWVKIQF